MEQVDGRYEFSAWVELVRRSNARSEQLYRKFRACIVMPTWSLVLILTRANETTVLTHELKVECDVVKLPRRG
jgi:hypothetical protein